MKMDRIAVPENIPFTLMHCCYLKQKLARVEGSFFITFWYHTPDSIFRIKINM